MAKLNFINQVFNKLCSNSKTGKQLKRIENRFKYKNFLKKFHNWACRPFKDPEGTEENLWLYEVIMKWEQRKSEMQLKERLSKQVPLSPEAFKFHNIMREWGNTASKFALQ